ncbi:CopD family protein [Bordetella genomosp. 13]|uniref:CopD family protein n=1 Tax=Bordetella genomosp. 13 TaxID=463040 RepID=UPI0011A7E851|nr:CopD family protein [Bordetella genomosp. 13]
MSLAMLYPWMKALHVAAALVFAGGVLAVAVFLRVMRGQASVLRAHAPAMRRWDRRVTTPAMLLVWALGVALAGSGYWSGSVWLPLKAVLVIVLSALHGVQSGRLRRAGQDGEPAAPWSMAAPSMVVLLAVVGILATAKPF